MDPLRKPLVNDDFAFRTLQANENLESLTRAISENQPIDALNQLFEQAESSIKAFEEYQPKNPQEKSRQSNSLTDFQRKFQTLLEKVEKSLEGTQKQMLFHDLHSDIDRHTAEHALKLQQKMLIVGDLMKDVAQTVHTQGETLDRIDIEVDKGKVFTGKATAELEKTDESQRRKKKCCWFILSVSFGAVIALIIVVVMITKN